MTDAWRDLLKAAFPDDEHRYFLPMKIGNTPSVADEGASAILRGKKTATSSGLWEFPDGHVPFIGVLSVVLDGKDRARAVVETHRITLLPFAAVDADFARAYGEGDLTLQWWRSEMGAWYRMAAKRHGQVFDNQTPIICEWFSVIKHL
jgi:uncharacterized protein YhfF